MYNLKKKFHYKLKYLILSYLLISIIGSFLILYNNKLYLMQDSFFHMGRILELVHTNRMFPNYALNSFHDIGSSVMSMYPYLFLYPIAFIIKITESIKRAIFITYILNSFITLIISYIGSNSFIKNNLVSYLFSITYTCSGQFIVMYFYSNEPDIGVYFSAIFLPLVLFGFLNCLKNGKWLMLSIGMSLIMYSNILTVIFVTGLLGIFLALNYKYLTIHKIINLGKAVILTLSFTSIVWIPILKLSILNNLNTPSSSYVAPASIKLIITNILFDNLKGGCQSLTIFSWIGCLIGGILFCKLPILIKKLYLFSIFIIILSTKIFPWELLSHYFIALRHIQSPVRFLVIPQIILEFIMSYCLIIYSKKYKKRIFLVVILIMILFVQVNIFQNKYINSCKYNMTQSQIIHSSLYNNNTDYWPKEAYTKKSDLFHNEGILNQTKCHILSRGNGYYIFKNNVHGSMLQLPFLYYNGVNYRIYLNNKLIKYHYNKYKLMTIRNVKPGYNRVHIIINLDKALILSRFLTIMGFIIYIYILFKNKLKES